MFSLLKKTERKVTRFKKEIKHCKGRKNKIKELKKQMGEKNKTLQR